MPLSLFFLSSRNAFKHTFTRRYTVSCRRTIMTIPYDSPTAVWSFDRAHFDVRTRIHATGSLPIITCFRGYTIKIWHMFGLATQKCTTSKREIFNEINYFSGLTSIGVPNPWNSFNATRAIIHIRRAGPRKHVVLKLYEVAGINRERSFTDRSTVTISRKYLANVWKFLTAGFRLVDVDLSHRWLKLSALLGIRHTASLSLAAQSSLFPSFFFAGPPIEDNG